MSKSDEQVIGIFTDRTNAGSADVCASPLVDPRRAFADVELPAGEVVIGHRSHHLGSLPSAKATHSHAAVRAFRELVDTSSCRIGVKVQDDGGRRS